MSKFSFVVCAFALVAVNCVLGQEDNANVDLEDSKNKTLSFINCQIEHIQNLVKEIPTETSETTQKLREQSISVAKLAYEHFFSTQEKANSEIKNALTESLENNLTECFEMAVHFEQETFAALEKTRSCLFETKVASDNLQVSINANSTKLLETLNSFKTDAENCIQIIDESHTVSDAQKCVHEVSKKSTWYIIGEVNSFYTEVANLNTKISNFLPLLPECAIQNGVEKDNVKSVDILTQVQNCVKAKKN